MKTNKRKISKMLIIGLFASLLFSACMKNWNFDELDNLSTETALKPRILLPMMSSTLKMSDLLQQAGGTYIDTTVTPDGMIHLKATVDIPETKIGEYFSKSGQVFSESPTVTLLNSLKLLTQEKVKQPLNLNVNGLLGKNTVIKIKSPLLSLHIFSNMNIPTLFLKIDNLRFYDQNGGNEKALVWNGLINSDIPIGNVDKTYNSIDAGSNLSDIMAMFPASVSYKYSLRNDPVEAGTSVKLNPTSVVSGNILIDIPFELYLSNFTINKTIEFPDISDLFDFEKDSISLSINMNVENAFPFSLGLQATFVTDTTKKGMFIGKLFSTKDSIVAGAAVDANGKMTSTTKSTLSPSINYTLSRKLKDAKFVKISASMSTTDADKQKYVKFLTSNYLKVKMVLQADVKYKVKF